MSASFRFTLELPGGLHARPASLLAALAGNAALPLTFCNERTGARCDCRSAMELLASDTRAGDACRIETAGDGAQALLQTVRELIEREWRPGREVTAASAGEGQRRLPRPWRTLEGAARFGTPVVPGVAVAPLWRPAAIPTALGQPGRPFSDAVREMRWVQEAEARLGAEIEAQIARGPLGGDILRAHLAILHDPELRRRIRRHVEEESCPAPQAVARAAAHYRAVLAASASPYIRERAADVDDIAGRWCALLEGRAGAARDLTLPGPVIAAVPRLTPAELLGMDTARLCGLVLGETGCTSHTAILARSLGVPTLAAEVPPQWIDGLEVLLDARRGYLLPAPEEALKRYMAIEQEAQRHRRERLRRSAGTASRTRDGALLEVAANVSTAAETAAAVAAGADGVGLFRTEMLYLERRTPPDEEEQTRIYTAALQAAAGRPVIIRTADIGGDKPLPWLLLPAEENPFLGCRAIRLYHRHPHLRDTQLRALLRASRHGRLQIMLPMVALAAEVRAVKARLLELHAELCAAGEALPAPPPLGVMLEIPAAAFQITELAAEVDFFSVGSNDLLQYFLAADRGLASLGELHRAVQPSFLRFLHFIAGQVQRSGKWLGICGEMAGDPRLLPLLVGLGFSEISLAVPRLAEMKHAVTELDAAACRELLQRAMACADADAVDALLHAFSAAGEDSPLAPELIRVDSPAAGRAEVIKELVTLLEASGRCDHGDAVEEAVWAREEIHSTAIGFGVAVPHCRSPHVRRAAIVLVRPAQAVEWPGGLDDEPVRLAILLALPAAAAESDHLKLLAALSRRLMHEDFRAALLQAGRPEEILDLLRRHLPL